MRYLFVLAVLVSLSAFAQTDTADRDCEKKAQNVSVDHPAKAMQAIADAKQTCMRDKQLRQIGLYRGARAVCNDTASAKADSESLSDAARQQIYLTCMKGHGYVQ